VRPAGERLLAIADRFLSKKARHTFSGYATAQLKRIKTHRRWILHPPAAPPTRAEHGLPERTVIPQDQLQAAEAAVKKQLDAWEPNLSGLDPAARIQIMGDLERLLAEVGAHADGKWRAAARAVGHDENFLELLDRERRYRGRQTEWEQYQSWRRTRNPARAALEEQHGYDTKHGMHLVRLLRMCREILEGGRVIVRRPDAEELLAIRAGAWPYDRLVEWAEREDAALEEVARRSALPHAPDRAALDAECVAIVASMI
jgi:predicted nucleotidyltransferase